MAKAKRARLQLRSAEREPSGTSPGRPVQDGPNTSAPSRKPWRRRLQVVGACCALAVLFWGGIALWGKDRWGGSASLGQEVPILGQNHVPPGTKVEYHSNPPTSGDHWPAPAPWGVYRSPQPDEQLVHNLEHGGVWISYQGIDDSTRAKLEVFGQKYPDAVVVTPRPENDRKIALASWGRFEKSDVLNEERIERFIRENVNKSPEPLASLEGGKLTVGAPFPAFSLTEVDGRTVTRDSLKGTPAIIWFTTAWCVPCQIGAREVARLDREVGGKAFDVLVVFVDPRETDADLRDWRRRFANEDWMVAFDNRPTSLAARVSLRYLDSKFLLDRNGVIQNIDFKIADADYLRTIRQVVRESQ